MGSMASLPRTRWSGLALTLAAGLTAAILAAFQGGPLHREATPQAVDGNGAARPALEVLPVADGRDGDGTRGSSQRFTLFLRLLLETEPENATGHARTLSARLAATGEGLIATAALVDTASGRILAEASAPPTPSRAGDPHSPPEFAALAAASGKLLGRSFDPLEVAIRSAEAECRAGDPVAGEARARALLSWKDDARLHHAIALSLEARGDRQAARGEWEEASRLAPADPLLHQGLARALGREGDPVGAAREYRLALERCPPAERAGIQEALRELEAPARREEARRAAWEEASKLAGAAREASAALRRSKAEEAAARAALLERRIRETPAEPAAWLARGELAMGEGRLEAAAADLNRAVELDPGSGKARLELGRALYQARNRDPEAEAQLREAARLLPEEAEPWILLGDLQVRRSLRSAGGLEERWSEHARGIPAFNLAAYSRPAAAGLKDGAMAAIDGEIERAVSFYRKAAGLAPGDGRTLARLADGLLLLGRSEEPLSEARAAAALGERGDALRVLASAYALSGNPGAAEIRLAGFLGKTARSAGERARAARRLLALCLAPEALEVLSGGLKEEPASAELLVLRARALFKLGRSGEAPDDLRLAVRLEENGPSGEKGVVRLLTDLAELLLALERPEEALSELKRPLALLASEEARLRGTRLPRPASSLAGELSRLPAAVRDPVDFGNGRDRAAFAMVRLLAGAARMSLPGDRPGGGIGLEEASVGFRWAARVVAVEKGSVLPEAAWQRSLSPRSRRIAAEALARLSLLEAGCENREAARGLSRFAFRLLEEPEKGPRGPEVSAAARGSRPSPFVYLPTAMTDLERAVAEELRRASLRR
jgi:tetratricopeptide (TPR) repeat protein